MLMPNTAEKSDLTKIIKSLRQEMIQIGLKEGLTSKNTVAISQKLDKYIAIFQSFTH